MIFTEKCEEHLRGQGATGLEVAAAVADQGNLCYIFIGYMYYAYHIYIYIYVLHLHNCTLQYHTYTLSIQYMLYIDNYDYIL